LFVQRLGYIGMRLSGYSFSILTLLVHTYKYNKIPERIHPDRELIYNPLLSNLHNLKFKSKSGHFCKLGDEIHNYIPSGINSVIFHFKFKQIKAKNTKITFLFLQTCANQQRRDKFGIFQP
jgi:hypothetical protein